MRENLPPVNCHVSHVNVTSIEGYIHQEIERAGRARNLYHDLSAENIRNVKVWLRRNQTKNVPVSIEDINLDEKIFKTDVATCKVTRTRPLSPMVTTNYLIELPTELVTARGKD